MPTISSGDKVLVTGANGFVALWVVRAFLEGGYAVRATVRSAGKGAHLQKLFAAHGDKFELVVVDDITRDGAFDEAVKGVDAVAHTASPFTFAVSEPSELIEPAVKGTVGILKSILAHGSAVKRVVITSSTAAVISLGLPEPKVFNESNWNDPSVAAVEQHGKPGPDGTPYKAPGAFIYLASKTLAERSAWDFVKQHKDEIKWDLAVLNPPYVFGPTLHEIKDVAALNESSAQFYAAVVDPASGGKTDAQLASQGDSWIDVRDLATAHVRALERAAAGGERLIIAAGSYRWQDFLDAANGLSPSPIPGHVLPKGVPGAGRNVVRPITLDTTKAAGILGIEYRSIDETTRDALADFSVRGF